MQKGTESFSSNKENFPSKNIQRPVFHQFRSRCLSEIIQAQYQHLIQYALKSKERKFDTSNSLANHRITPLHRSRMVDWMTQVLKLFNSNRQTLFLSIKIMDNFFKSQTRVIGVQQLHVIGVSCMFIASKFTEVKPLKLQAVYSHICHQNLSKLYIKKTQKEILKALNYDIGIPTVGEFLDLILKTHTQSEKTVAWLLSELVELDYQLSSYLPSVLAQAIALFSRNNFQSLQMGLMQGPVFVCVQELVEFVHFFKVNYGRFQAAISKYRREVPEDLYAVLVNGQSSCYDNIQRL